MALLASRGTFGTGTAASVVTVSPAAFSGTTPSLVVLGTSMQTTEGSNATHTVVSFAFVDGDANTYCIAGTEGDGVATSSAYNGQSLTRFGILTAAANTWASEFTVVPVTGGFELRPAAAPAFDHMVSYLCLGGDLTAAVSNESRTNSTGVQSLTVSSFGTPGALIMASTGRLGAPNSSGIQNHMEFDLGWATSASNDFAVAGYAQTGVGTSNDARLGAAGTVLSSTNKGTTPTVTWRSEFSGFITDGAQINWLETAAGPATQFGFVLLGGTDVLFDAGTFTTSATTGNLSDVAVSGIDISALLFASSTEDASDTDTLVDHWSQSVGWATSATARNCITSFGEDALGTTRAWSGHFTDRVYCRGATSSDAVEAIGDIADLSTDEQFTPTMDDAEPAADLATVGWLAIGVAPAAAGGGFGSGYYQHYYRNVVT